MLKYFIVIFLITNIWAEKYISVEDSRESKIVSQQNKIETYETISTIGSAPQFYEDVSSLWEEIAKELKLNIDSPGEKLSVAATQGELAYEKALNIWHEDLSNHFNLLKRTSFQRARALTALEAEDKNIFTIDGRLLERIILEVTLIPYTIKAYFYEQSYWFIQNSNKGFVGVLYLVWELLIILLILMVPLVFSKVSQRIDRYLEVQRKKSFRYSFKSKGHRNLTIVLSVASVYIPWLFALVSVLVVGEILMQSQFKEFSQILPYINYYIYYKIFRVTLEIWLQEFASSTAPNHTDHLKVKKTSQTLGLFLLIIYSLQTAFQSILGESLVFLIIKPFFGFMVLALLLFVSSRWSAEIKNYLRNTNLVYLKKYSDLMVGHFNLLLSLPGLFIVLVHYFGKKLVFWSSQFELVKLLYAKVLRVKFESSKNFDANSSGPDLDYLERFKGALEDNHLFVSFETEFFKKIKTQVTNWQDGQTNEQTIAIYGAKGSGKTQFIKQYVKRLRGQQSLEIKIIDVPPRVFTEKNFETLFVEKAGLELKETSTRQYVFIDNAQNLFLSTIGGFEIYKRFLQLIEENKEIFWIVSFNEYSWQFLNSVLGKNQYFRQELKMPLWSVESIKELILATNEKVGGQLEYDQIFKSSQKLQEGVASAESRYFYLLWERCGGNPGLAIAYWFRSLNEIGQNRYIVSLPRDNNSSELSLLHQEMHFVYASLMKHENLSVSEASRATNLPRPVVKQAVFRGLEEGFLEQDENRYRISINWIDDIKKYLKGKNLIYDSNG